MRKIIGLHKFAYRSLDACLEDAEGFTPAFETALEELDFITWAAIKERNLFFETILQFPDPQAWATSFRDLAYDFDM